MPHDGDKAPWPVLDLDAFAEIALAHRFAVNGGPDANLSGVGANGDANVIPSLDKALAEYEAYTKASWQLNPPKPIDNAIRVLHTGIYYNDKEIIGTGATSIIYNGYHIAPSRPAAIKRIILSDPKSVKIYKNELDVWLSVTQTRTLENVNIVQLFEWNGEASPTTSSYYFAMELATTDLSKRILEFKDNPADPSHDKLVGYLHDATCGLKWLHSQKHPIIHRDIKPHNILIFTSGSGEIAKLADFGISRVLSGSSTGTNTCGVGSSDWMSPEAIQATFIDAEFRNTTSMDVFSLGMTCYYAMSLGEHPFWGGFIAVNIADLKKLPNNLTNIKLLGANHLFQWMMSKEGPRRPKIWQILSHCFYFSVDKCLEFIVDVAKCLSSNKNGEAEQFVQNKLDTEFENIYCKIRHVDKVNWREVLGDSAYDWLTTRRFRGKRLRSSYEVGSGVSLAILIRDKWVHHTDLVDELVESEEYFGEMEEEEWRFSERKYAAYFIDKFPELVPVFWTTIAIGFGVSEMPILATVKKKYFVGDFGMCPVLH